MTFDEVLSKSNQMLTDEELNSMMREKYPGPAGAKRLSENLVSILGAEHPEGQTIRGPINIVQPNADSPALNVIPFPDANVPATNIGGGGGGLNPADVVFPTPPDPGGLGTVFPITLYGIVQSGTGNNYVVTLWMLDPDTDPPLGNFNCYQGQIDPSETIPPLTHCSVMAMFSGSSISTFRMLAPVFVPAA